ncbi:MAG: hypothetical protein A2X78_03510 [Gammaproteobacteria bacterium GWE2_37_16]|nr:MAG: hypothetical protein A2X78_03510 [Gammaproteobacteria bacterium GWE2_37_16]
MLIADRPVDLRKATDGLCALVMESMQEKPDQGIYVFYNRACNRIKVLGWHGNGFVLLYKRLEKGKFFIRTVGNKINIDVKQLNWLIAGLDWQLLSTWEEPKFSTFF